MHIDEAKNQRRVVKDLLKLSVRDLLSNERDFHLSCEEFDACINHWNCNHEIDTASSDVLVSHENALVFDQVSF